MRPAPSVASTTTARARPIIPGGTPTQSVQLHATGKIYPDLSAHSIPALPQSYASQTRSKPAVNSDNSSTRQLIPMPALIASSSEPSFASAPSKLLRDISQLGHTVSLCAASQIPLPKALQQPSQSQHLPTPLQPEKPLSDSIRTPLTEALLASLGFARRYNRIVHPSNLAGPKVGIDTYHVVICGQEVGIFYAQ